jgi:hypothetical protein
MGFYKIPFSPYLPYVELHFSGDPTVMYMHRRLKKALAPDGWRGRAELDIAQEDEMQCMNQERHLATYTANALESSGVIGEEKDAMQAFSRLPPSSIVCSSSSE